MHANFKQLLILVNVCSTTSLVTPANPNMHAGVATIEIKMMDYITTIMYVHVYTRYTEKCIRIT